MHHSNHLAWIFWWVDGATGAIDVRCRGGCLSSAGVPFSGGWGKENVRRKRTGSVVDHNLKIKESFPQKLCKSCEL